VGNVRGSRVASRGAVSQSPYAPSGKEDAHALFLARLVVVADEGDHRKVPRSREARSEKRLYSYS